MTTHTITSDTRPFVQPVLPTAAEATAEKVQAAQTRFYALDLVRLIAMLLMMQGHVLSALVSSADLNTGEFPWSIWHFIRGLTAPVFLMTSGAVHVFANKRNADGEINRTVFFKRLRWGITLIGIGYLMVFPANRIFDLPFVPTEVWHAFFRVNILQLTCVALILLMFVISLTRSTRTFANASLAIALGITFLAPFVEQVDWFALAPEWLASYFSYAHGSIFPFFPFAAYMFFGVSVGKHLQSIPAAKRMDAFPKFTGIAGAVITALALLATVQPFTIFPAHSYHLTGPDFVMLRVGLTLLFMSLIGLLYRATHRWGKYYSLFGKKTLHIYVGHLVLLYGTPWFHTVQPRLFGTLSLAEGISVAVLIITTCLAGVYLLDYYQQNSRRFRQALPYTVMVALAYALLV